MSNTTMSAIELASAIAKYVARKDRISAARAGYVAMPPAPTAPTNEPTFIGPVQRIPAAAVASAVALVALTSTTDDETVGEEETWDGDDAPAKRVRSAAAVLIGALASDGIGLHIDPQEEEEVLSDHALMRDAKRAAKAHRMATASDLERDGAARCDKRRPGRYTAAIVDSPMQADPMGPWSHVFTATADADPLKAGRIATARAAEWADRAERRGDSRDGYAEAWLILKEVQATLDKQADDVLRQRGWSYTDGPAGRSAKERMTLATEIEAARRLGFTDEDVLRSGEVGYDIDMGYEGNGADPEEGKASRWDFAGLNEDEEVEEVAKLERKLRPAIRAMWSEMRERRLADWLGWIDQRAGQKARLSAGLRAFTAKMQKWSAACAKGKTWYYNYLDKAQADEVYRAFAANGCYTKRNRPAGQ